MLKKKLKYFRKNSIEIEKGSTQYTNIYDALRVGFLELVSPASNQNSSKVSSAIRTLPSRAYLIPLAFYLSADFFREQWFHLSNTTNKV